MKPAEVDAIVADYRQALIAELAAIRAYEHRYQDFSLCAARGRQIQAELSALPLPVTTREDVAA